MKNKIGQRVKQARKKANLTQEALAEQANLSASLISRLENGNAMPSISSLCTIASALDVGLQDLLLDLFTFNSPSDTAKRELMNSIELLSPKEIDHLLQYLKLLNELLNQ